MQQSHWDGITSHGPASMGAAGSKKSLVDEPIEEGTEGSEVRGEGRGEVGERRGGRLL